MPKARKSIPDLSHAEYQAFVRRLEKRHAPDQTWEQLPIIHGRRKPSAQRPKPIGG